MLFRSRQRALKLDWSQYNAPNPYKAGITRLDNIPVSEVREFINWKYFFNAWKVSGNFPFSYPIIKDEAIYKEWIDSVPLEKREKAIQAFTIYKDTNQLLDTLDLTMNYIVGIFKAYCENETIFIKTENETFKLPTFRQQSDSIQTLSISDFIAPSSVEDYIGTFAVAIGKEFSKYLKIFNDNNDDYNAILIQTLADRDRKSVV